MIAQNPPFTSTTFQRTLSWLMEHPDLKEAPMTVETHRETLIEKHTDLEQKIHEEASRPMTDDLLIAQLKRQKLRIKDELAEHF